jgi:hypothetical protein
MNWTVAIGTVILSQPFYVSSSAKATGKAIINYQAKQVG